MQQTPRNPSPVFTNKAIDYFYKNNIKLYYCQDYLKALCNPADLPVNPLPVDLDVIQAGSKLYLQHCTRCHGDTGRGNGPDAVRLGIPPARLVQVGNGMLEKDAFLFWIIAEGGTNFGGQMPQFKDLLSENEIWKVMLFLKTLR